MGTGREGAYEVLRSCSFAAPCIDSSAASLGDFASLGDVTEGGKPFPDARRGEGPELRAEPLGDELAFESLLTGRTPVNADRFSWGATRS